MTDITTLNQSCGICTESFDQGGRNSLACNLCQFTACLGCWQQFLLTKTHMGCMKPDCRYEWTYKSLSANFGGSFVKGALRKHRQTLFYDGEKILLPQTQEAAEEVKNCKQIQKLWQAKNDDLDKQINGCYQALYRKVPQLVGVGNLKMGRRLVQDIPEAIVAIDLCRSTRDALFREKISEYELYKLKNKIETLYTRGITQRTPHRMPVVDGQIAPVEQRRQFIKHCPSNDCRGYLSTLWKCGLCLVQVCAKCHVVKTDSDNHTCDPGDIATAEFLMRDTKPCPKCGTAIHKIEGCDQMWCTQCQTAFSWATGDIITGTIHNPHFFQWMRTQNPAALARNPLDFVCGRTLDHMLVHAVMTLLRIEIGMAHGELTQFQTIFENILFVKETAENKFRVHDMMNNHKLRVQYLNQELTEDAFARRIFIRYRHNEINREMRYSLLLFRDVATELAFNLLEHLRKRPERFHLESIETFRRELQAIQDMVLTDLKNVCKLFEITVRTFDVFAKVDDWLHKLFPIS